MFDTGPATVDIDLWRGSNAPPLIFALQNEDETPFDTTGSVFYLTITWLGGSLHKNTAANAGFTLDPTTSELTWAPTLAESRLIPAGRAVTYEIERRIGLAQEPPLIVGSIFSKGGRNDD